MDRIVVLGGGVLGTMHAAQARRLGHEVVHLEREAGALHCRQDAIVEPREVPRVIREHLLATAGRPAAYTWLPGREAVEVAPHSVHDHTGAWHRGDLVVLCTGAAHTGVAGPHLAGYGRMPVRRVRLQMMQTAPYPDRLTTSVADGDSLRYYPAYALPGRDRLQPQEPAGAAFRAQLLLVQRLDGILTIGDTHEYGEPFAFDLDEAAYDHLRGRAEMLLGSPLPRRCAAGRACTARSPPMSSITGPRSRPGCSWSPAPGGAA